MYYMLTHREFLTDREIVELYHNVAEEGFADMLFYDNGVNSAAGWLAFAKHQWLVKVDNEYGENAGFFWLNGFQGRTAQVHFCTRRDYKNKVEAGQTALQWLRDHDIVDSLYGCTPKIHRAALMFIKRLGFSVVGELPGACYVHKLDEYVPGMVSVLDIKQKKGERHGRRQESASHPCSPGADATADTGAGERACISGHQG